MNLTLGDVQETALIPLAIKANETKRENPRITDNKAVEIIEQLGVDTEKYDKFFSHEGVVARTIIIDRIVKSFVEKYPDAVCVNLGCGFDDRFSRADNGRIMWYDIDLPDSIEVRRKVYDETERRRMISGSVLEKEWADNVQKDRKTIIIAEGLLMYFSREQVRTLIEIIADKFPEGIFDCELMHPAMTGGSKHHDTVKNTNAKFGWGTKSGHELEELNSSLQLVREESLNSIVKKYSAAGVLMASLPVIRKLNNRIAVFKVKG